MRTNLAAAQTRKVYQRHVGEPFELRTVEFTLLMVLLKNTRERIQALLKTWIPLWFLFGVAVVWFLLIQFEVLETAVLPDPRNGPAFALRARDVAPFPGGRATDDYWRAMMPVGDRMVTLTVMGLAAAPLSREAGLDLLREWRAEAMSSIIPRPWR